MEPAKYVETADNRGKKIVEVVRYSASQLAQRLELRHLAHLLIGLIKLPLFGYAIRDVSYELIRSYLPAGIVSQSIELHLVSAAISACVAIFSELQKLFSIKGAAPDFLHALALGGKVMQRIQHGLAHSRTLAKYSLELVARSPIHCKPPKLVVRYLNERVGPLDNVRKYAAFGESVRNASLQLQVESFQFSLFGKNGGALCLDLLDIICSNMLPSAVSQGRLGRRHQH
jgi:hypothetical protein